MNGLGMDYERDEIYAKSLHHRARREIRLVEILPGRWADGLQCHLSVHQLGSCPAYNALSYTWGSVAVLQWITVNDKQLGVTYNLESALRLCRRLTEPVIMWIDAIVGS
jgi:hypothetical protein